MKPSRTEDVVRKGYTIRRHVTFIEIDCSEWGKLLEVAFPISRSVSKRERSKKVALLVDAIDAIDAAQGGSKFRLLDQKAVGSNLVLTLAPITPEQAKARIERVIESLNRIAEKEFPIAYAKVA